MEKFNSYLCVNANLDRIVTADEVAALKSALSNFGFRDFEIHLAIDTRLKDEPIENPNTPDTPDTSTYTEQAYPAPAEEPEQPEQPKEEPKEEPAPVPKDVTKDELKAALREYRDRFGWEALHELYDRFGNGATKLVDLEQGQYAPMYAGAQEKLGDA